MFSVEKSLVRKRAGTSQFTYNNNLRTYYKIFVDTLLFSRIVNPLKVTILNDSTSVQRF